MPYEQLKETFTAAGQGHLFTFWDELSEDQRASLLDSLDKIDVARVNRIYKKATTPATPEDDTGAIAPLPDSSFDSTIETTKDKIAEWQEIGLKKMAEGKVAVILLAGGQGTRLGSKDPKGCYDIGLPSHKSLFRLQGERIGRLQKLAQKYSEGNAHVVIPWYVMTSGPTKAPTVAYFESQSYFGLDPANIIFFEQGVLPAFTTTGKIFLENKYTPALSPDGNGGIYAALRREGVLADLEKRGIPYIHAYCVDNCLVKVADPVFLGYCIQKGADSACKSVPKKEPDEPVGVICLRSGKPSVVEYSEIDPKMAALTKPNSTKLVYNAANIANHFYTLDFLKRIEGFEGELDYHIASKKIKHVDLESGREVSPSKANGIKLELFIFDVLPHTSSFTVLEVDRHEEFSPLKNGPGAAADCPETSRADILAQCVRFAEAAGAKVVKGEDDTSDVPTLEISPEISYGGEGLEGLEGKTIVTPKVIGSAEDF